MIYFPLFMVYNIWLNGKSRSAFIGLTMNQYMDHRFLPCFISYGAYFLVRLPYRVHLLVFTVGNKYLGSKLGSKPSGLKLLSIFQFFDSCDNSSLTYDALLSLSFFLSLLCTLSPLPLPPPFCVIAAADSFSSSSLPLSPNLPPSPLSPSLFSLVQVVLIRTEC